MNGTENLLVTSIEEMIARAAKRLVAHRLLFEGLPPSQRSDHRREHDDGR